MSTVALQTVQLAPGQAAWQRFRRHKLAMAGAVTILILILGSALALIFCHTTTPLSTF